MRTLSKEELKRLYDEDFPLWAEINLELLKEKAYDLVDWENLLEEIEDMAKSDLKACISYLAVILEHLYKWDNFKDLAGEEHTGRKWIKSINGARREIDAKFKQYPSLRNKLPQELEKAWIEARKELYNWLEDNDYEPDDFYIPEECPYTYEEAMSRDLKKELKI
ncbi:MAG: DUF29 domain-containing protein [Hydrogenobacter thermophilus]|uniref:DUF29 domain-containing protein n=1 Tax=Hydrogenobacter thermophilus TaxID=940 RepID=UPI001C791A27|nr:DUF29 domain-containing protein [Hydrogenobacter thermophilus]QWK20625.1 MAG: DUF29 domain-containing protein [Hydrogenobacter thermophilus]